MTCKQCFPEGSEGNPAATAALNGHIDCLRKAKEQEHPLDAQTLMNAGISGNMDCMRYLHKHIPEADWKADDRISLLAAKHGNLQCLTYAIENGAPFFNATNFAAERGHLDCLKYALEKGGRKEKVTFFAANGGRLECLKYAFEHGCPWEESTTIIAAQRGFLDCLRYAHENGASLTHSENTGSAASGGHLDCLKYLHENGAPWNVQTTLDGARHKKLDILRYACEKGAPIHPDALSSAIVWGNFECARYLHDKGAPFNPRSLGRIGPDQIQCIARLYYTIPECWEPALLGCEYIRPILMEHGFCPPTLTNEWKTFTTARCSIFKYELIKVAWHPERHVDWCLPHNYQDWFVSINKKRKHVS